MAAPNIVNVSSILGKTDQYALTTTNQTTILNNAASSDNVLKVNMIQVANVDGTYACDITIDVHSADDGAGTAFSLVSTVSVPADASLIVIDKNTAIYLEEDMSITATAGTASDLEVIISYEQITD